MRRDAAKALLNKQILIREMHGRGRSKINSKVRYLCFEVDDAIAITEEVDICLRDALPLFPDMVGDVTRAADCRSVDGVFGDGATLCGALPR